MQSSTFETMMITSNFPVTTQSKAQGTKPPIQQVLGANDVICGRHKDSHSNVGNRRFRVLVALLSQKYIDAPTRVHKSMVIRDVVDTVHKLGGKFVRSTKMKIGANRTTVWEELVEKQIYDKIGHAFRDMTVSMREKSDINKLLSPRQPTECSSDATMQPVTNDIYCTTTSNSVQMHQDAKAGEEQNTMGDVNSSRTNEYDDDETTEDDDDVAISAFASIFENTTSNYDYIKGSFRHSYTSVANHWRRDSVKSFQCLII